MKFGIGQPLRRKEDGRFLTGTGRYVDDLARPGEARGYMLRSPHAHGRILSIDAEDARGMPGVLAVYTGADVEGRLAPLPNELPFEGVDGSTAAPAVHPHLATDKVRFVGQGLAYVVAETIEQARDAAEAIVFDIEDLPAVVDPTAALKPGAPQLHDEAPGNLAYTWSIGDGDAVEAAFAKAHHVAKVKVCNQRLVVASMETRAITAEYDTETDRWEIWAGSQGVHGIRGRIALALAVEPSRLRVHTPDVGGGFGMKLMAHTEYGLTCLAAQDIGRPVKWIGERSDAMLADCQGRDLTTEAEGAFDEDGRILAFRWSSLSNLGGYYSSFGAGIHTSFSSPIVGGMYRLPAYVHRVRGVFTNTTPTDAYRGAGRPEMIYVTERLMERAARDMDIDPVELRLKNLLTSADAPFATHGGMTFDSLDPPTNVQMVVDASDRAGFAARRAEAGAHGKLLGYGLCYYMERTGGGPIERAELALLPDGSATLRVGTQSTGQGHETAWAQVVHEELGIDWDRITLLAADSDALKAGGGTGGSRSLIMASRTIILAAGEIIDKARKLAAEKLEAAEADIEFSASEGGLFRIAGTDRTVKLTELAADQGGLDGAGDVSDREATYPNGSHAAEVEIDPDTGHVRIVRYTIVDDFGKLVNPLLVEGQVHGGVVQGAGQALMEHAVWDPDTGQPLTASFMDYAMPRAADTPMLPVMFNEGAPCQTNPLGVKGCGEAGAVAATPAVTLAVLDALHAAGAPDIDTPLTPEKVWNALNAASRAAA